ncbi:MAG: hypothetical protein ISN26_01815 [Betaproteobacteria bacterium AqS2]|uniref:Acetyl-CoA carboxylase n=1 Tax=Candidatus Amphirhobacter heronislandensis TaxID=1732024 RepID=A0A930UC22_9GAMM|nr:hypothetical protein [Betaproteobacteria bacterium AqS2]
MDLRKLKTILELFENSDIQEMELTEDKETIRLAKGPGGAVTVTPPPPAPVQAPPPAHHCPDYH